MKSLAIMLCLLLSIFASNAQQKFPTDKCPPIPTRMTQNDFDNLEIDLCDMLEGHRFEYIDQIKKFADVAKSDSKEIAKSKVQAFWLKYITCLKCYDAIHGEINPMFFSVRHSYAEFFKVMNLAFGVDINIKDASGKTVLDFIVTEKNKYLRRPNSIEEVKKLSDLENELRKDYKAKLGSEIK